MAPKQRTIDRFFATFIPAVTILMISIAYFFLARDIIYYGDDISYYIRFIWWKADWKGLPITMHMHWDEWNGRMCDMLAGVPLNIMGANGRGIANAIMTALMLTMPLVIVGFRKSVLFYRMLLITLISMTLRWDSLWMENITQQDYVWTTAYALLAVWLIVRNGDQKSLWWEWLLMPFCMSAGWMHEALGLPLAAGLLAFYFTSPFLKKSSSSRKGMCVAFTIGSIMPLLNINNYNKFFLHTETVQREPLMEMLFCSTYYLIILIAASAVLYFTKRDLLKTIICSQWTVWSVASVTSTCVMVTVGYGGRPGWFAQIFALLSIFIIICKLDWSPVRGGGICLSAIMFTALLFHYWEVVKWQHRLSVETITIINRLQQSPTGTVFGDYTLEKDLPWHVLRKPHAFPDEDEPRYRSMMSGLYAEGKQITVLPEAARTIEFDTLSAPQTIGVKTISPYPISGKDLGYPQFGNKVKLKSINGKETIEWAFQIKPGGKTYYLYAPRDEDRGEK